jgi:hypothetical protein
LFGAVDNLFMLGSRYTYRLELTVKTSSLSLLHDQENRDDKQIAQYAIIPIDIPILLAEEAQRGEAVEGD